MDTAHPPAPLGEESEKQQSLNHISDLVTQNDFTLIQEKIGLVFPGWEADTNNDLNQIKENNILLVVKSPTSEECPQCKTEENVYKHGVREAIFLDIPRNNYRVGLLVKRQRLRCLKCKKAFFSPLAELSIKRKMTNRLVEWIEEKAKRDTYANVARECGVSAKMVREIWLEKHPVIKGKLPDRAVPKFLGIDEVYVGMKFRCVLTDLKEKRVFDILDDRMRDSLQKYIRNLPNKNAIQVVCIDMHDQYLEAIHNVALKAKIVVDRFHVVSLAIRALDKVRIRLQKDLRSDKERKELRRLGKILLRQRRQRLNDSGRAALEKWLSRYPELNVAYWLKEGVVGLYAHGIGNRTEAEEHYEQWLAALPHDLKEFTELVKTIEKWKEEIFAYFDVTELPNSVSNGFTEQVNRQIKAINSKGRGYRFDYLREKILQGDIGAKIKHGGAYRRVFKNSAVDISGKVKQCKPKEEEDGSDKKTEGKKRGAKPYAVREEKEQYVSPLIVIAEAERLKVDFSYTTQINLLVEKKQGVADEVCEPKEVIATGLMTQPPQTTVKKENNGRKRRYQQKTFDFVTESPDLPEIIDKEGNKFAIG